MRKSIRKIGLAIVSAAGLTAAVLATPAQASEYTTPIGQWSPHYVYSGAWAVPDQVIPGAYRIEPAPGTNLAAYKICRWTNCEPGESGHIASDFIYGPTYVPIPPDAISILLVNAKLTAYGS